MGVGEEEASAATVNPLFQALLWPSETLRVERLVVVLGQNYMEKG